MTFFLDVAQTSRPCSVSARWQEHTSIFRAGPVGLCKHLAESSSSPDFFFTLELAAETHEWYQRTSYKRPYHIYDNTHFHPQSHYTPFPANPIANTKICCSCQHLEVRTGKTKNANIGNNLHRYCSPRAATSNPRPSEVKNLVISTLPSAYSIWCHSNAAIVTPLKSTKNC